MTTQKPGAQEIVHAIDQGKLAPVIRMAMFGALIITLTLLYLFVQFRGLPSSTAMDQAQIARNIADGKGFTTKYIRPFAIWQLENAGKEVPSENFPDFFNSPLNPFVNALPLKLVQSQWKLSPTDLIYIGDRVIAGTAIVFFLLSVVIWYLIGKKLFDQKLSLIGCAIILLTDLMWQFTLSGLPQMLMLFLFSIAAFCTLTAMEKRSSAPAVLGLLFAAGIAFGLMVLAHGAAIWIFLGWLAFALLYFQPRGVAGLVAVGALAIVVIPWLARNYSVSGSPLGIAGYELVAPVNSGESGYLRSISGPPPFSGINPLHRLKNALFLHTEDLFSFLGMNLAAAMFFVSLIHRFRSKNTAMFRWCILLMWLGAFAAMAFCGVQGNVSRNQFHVLFIPIFVFYGLAFLMVLYTRLEVQLPAIRIAFLSLVVFLCSLPLLATLLAGQGVAIQWPPYVPPFIAILSDWFDEKEVIASDMPWAVAWYANRPSILLPQTVKDFNKLSDYRVLGSAIHGLYLTPVTGNQRLFGDIYKGAYTDWVFLITRPPNVQGFPLQFFTPLPIDGECIIFADRDRWSRRE
jgi:Dolichyl-phosphate-mannose-protein mannosyltransferase